MTELWRELGGYEPMVDDGIDMVVAEARLRYLAPLRFDDEVDLMVGPIALGTTSMTSELAIDRGGRDRRRGRAAPRLRRPRALGQGADPRGGPVRARALRVSGDRSRPPLSGLWNMLFVL